VYRNQICTCLCSLQIYLFTSCLILLSQVLPLYIRPLLTYDYIFCILVYPFLVCIRKHSLFTCTSNTCHHCRITLYICFYTVSQKKLQISFCQNFVKFPPILVILAERWQRGQNYAKCTHFPSHLIRVTTLPC